MLTGHRNVRICRNEERLPANFVRTELGHLRVDHHTGRSRFLSRAKSALYG